MLNIAGKIFACILLNRLNGHLEQGLLPESQCGFRRHRGITDMVVAARQLQEKCQEMRTHLYTTFVDLTKAFDMVNRDGLWKVTQKFGCPECFTHIVRQIHDAMTARVTDNGTVSEAFAVTNGVKQGCILAPTQFSLILCSSMHGDPPQLTWTVQFILFADDGRQIPKVYEQVPCPDELCRAIFSADPIINVSNWVMESVQGQYH
ncbi:unnamed protein product [Schistocephalus solidus]|uniref:Reverse transcriptase domain-containing protein n=1 Tax=Schistocephalus solidus TaxID=70667 RepID=A0A3P7CXK9_SCHSO|nr:unnamed protein product [Schistocephalus solidus]